MKNEFCWVQLQSSHLEKAKTFYLDLFDWSLSDVAYPTFTYTEIDAGKGHCGGMMPGSKDTPSYWFPYVKVRDIQLYTQKAKYLGAEVLMEPTLIPDDEYISVIKDPTGAVIGLHQPSYGFEEPL